jgi:hypothetical protein
MCAASSENAGCGAAGGEEGEGGCGGVREEGGGDKGEGWVTAVDAFETCFQYKIIATHTNEVHGAVVPYRGSAQGGGKRTPVAIPFARAWL